MADMKTLTQKSDTELQAFIMEQRAVVQQNRFGLGTRDVLASRRAKQAIARAMTILTARRQTSNATK
jgi:ribosomal protein L29